MKHTKVKKVNRITILAIALLLIAILASVLMINLNTHTALAFHYIEEDLYHWAEDLYIEQSDYFGIMPMSSNKKKNDKGRHITKAPFPNIFFEGATYIPEADFFIRNPYHKENTSDKDDDNFVHRFGVCTSVAAQLVISYHNYFTDRRMIPEVHNGERFLVEDYGNLNYWPSFNLMPQTRRWSSSQRVYIYLSQGMCHRTGTTDAMFMDKYNRIMWSPNAVFAQTPAYVARSMNRFLGCGYESLSNEEHIKRISERVEERFFGENSEYPYTDFTVTILYSLTGDPKFFMVEFKPNGFFYGSIYRNEYYVDDNENVYRGNGWRVGEQVGQRGWMMHDEQQYRSHFYIEQILGERKYIHPSSFAKHGFLHPMIRKENNFVEIGGDLNISTNNIQSTSPNYRGRRISDLRW